MSGPQLWIREPKTHTELKVYSTRKSFTWDPFKWWFYVAEMKKYTVVIKTMEDTSIIINLKNKD